MTNQNELDASATADEEIPIEHPGVPPAFHPDLPEVGPSWEVQHFADDNGKPGVRWVRFHNGELEVRE